MDENSEISSWYLLYCKRSEQERAVLHLHRQGVDCYYPQITVEKFVRGKRQQVKEPLFPSYLFVYFNPSKISLTTVRSTRGVADFVRSGRHCQVVQPDIVHRMMNHETKMEEMDTCVNEAPKEGDSFIFTKGEFTGLEAIYAEKDGEKRSFMLINLLGQQVKLSIDNKYLG
jgi:transcriptional antiterminator RfaH